MWISPATGRIRVPILSLSSWYGGFKSGGCPMIMERTQGNFLNGVRNCAVSSVTYTGAPLRFGQPIQIADVLLVRMRRDDFRNLWFHRRRCRDSERRIFGEPGSTATPS